VRVLNPLNLTEGRNAFEFGVASNDHGVFPYGRSQKESVSIRDRVASVNLCRFVDQVVSGGNNSKAHLKHATNDTQLGVFAKVFLGYVNDFTEIYDLEKR